MKVKHLSTVAKWETVIFLKRSVSALHVCNAAVERVSTADMKASWQPQNEVSSLRKGSRKVYLEQNVLKSYYENKEHLTVETFSKGR